MVGMKAIFPGPFKPDVFRPEFVRSMKEFINGPIDQDFQATVKTWSEKPEFEKTVGTGAEGVTGKEETGDQKYAWVSKGTKDHMVPKSGTATMAFPSAYSAKTAPRVIGSWAGGPSGPVIVRTGAWMVKGITAREFPETIAKKRWPTLIRYGLEAISRGRAKCGHAI